jgi:DHA3 family macrolide efflux protein-like MFS transporter
MATTEQSTLEMSEVASPVDRKQVWIFYMMWFGQLVSHIGSGLTTFAMGVWVYQQTGSAAKFTTIALLSGLPGLVLMPIAGALVDRWDKRWTMLLSEAICGVASLSMLLMTVSGRLTIAHIYICVVVFSIVGTFGSLAYYPAITLTVPKRMMGRISGMTHASQATSQIAGPLLGGLMIAFMGLQTIFLADVLTFIFAIATLLIIHIPKVEKTQEEENASPSIFREALYGWTYIRERPSLLSIILFFTTTNFFLTMALVLFSPMILSFHSAPVLGTLNSISGVGMLVGSLVMSAWGGPKDRVRGILGFSMMISGSLILIGLTPSVLIIAVALFALYFAIPLANSCSQALWQVKTPPEVQGRVFSLRRMISGAMSPISFAVAGRIADRWFEPALASGGVLSDSVGRVFGVGPGHGMAFIFVLCGATALILQTAAFKFPTLRRAESILPDAIAD